MDLKACKEMEPSQVLTYTWFTALGFIFISVIIAIVVAADVGSGTVGAALGFAAIWLMFILIAVGAGGTMTLRKYKTSLSVGFFTGTICSMAAMMLVLFCVFAGVSESDAKGKEAAGWQAAFSFLDMLVFGIFGILLYCYRDSVIQDELPEHQHGPSMSEQSNPASYDYDASQDIAPQAAPVDPAAQKEAAADGGAQPAPTVQAV